MAPQLVSLEEARALGLGKTPPKSGVSEFETEKAALKAFGIDLSNDHLDGYKYKPERIEHDTNSVQRPWEVPMLQQLGPESVAKKQGL